MDMIFIFFTGIENNKIFKGKSHFKPNTEQHFKPQDIFTSIINLQIN